ncbi:MAG: transposase, partial [Eubacteriaceae bacterium]|nr:transposase [Eubacteriaceae bacterium]
MRKKAKNCLKIVILAYAKKIRSERAIGEASKKDAGFIWLLGGDRPPHHSTIGRFIHSRLCKALDHVEAEMSRALKEMGEAGGETLYQDGTKLESRAGRYTFAWRKSVEKNLEKL